MTAPILVSVEKLNTLAADNYCPVEHFAGYRWVVIGRNTFRTIIRDEVAA